MRFARLFIDAPDRRIVRKKGDIRNLMNLHNNEAGRRVSAQFRVKRFWDLAGPKQELENIVYPDSRLIKRFLVF
jgi:hypothetical protein